MSQQRQAIVFEQPADDEFEDKRHVKLIGKLYDQVPHHYLHSIHFSGHFPA